MAFSARLDDDVLRLMAPGYVEQCPHGKINSLDFHRSKDLLVTASNDDVVRVYNTATGQYQQHCDSRKYGAGCVRWTHSPTAIVYASTKAPAAGHDPNDAHAVRYLDLHHGTFIRYFKGHSKEVIHINMSPKTDTMFTSSTDKSVRLWDLRTNICQAKLDTNAAAPCATFDQQAMIFGVGLESGIIKLYDVRNYSSGPFKTVVVEQLNNSPLSFSQLQFSMDGLKFLAVLEGSIFVLDAFTGAVITQLYNGVPEGGSPREACFSCDSQYVLSGCADKAIRAWSATTGAEVAAWQGHISSPSCIAWAPQRLLVASGGHDLVMWLPDVQKLQQYQQQRQQQQPQQQQLGAVAVSAPVLQAIAMQPQAAYNPTGY